MVDYVAFREIMDQMVPQELKDPLDPEEMTGLLDHLDHLASLGHLHFIQLYVPTLRVVETIWLIFSLLYYRVVNLISMDVSIQSGGDKGPVIIRIVGDRGYRGEPGGPGNRVCVIIASVII